MQDYVGINNSRLNIVGCKIKMKGDFIDLYMHVVKNDSMKNIIILDRNFLQTGNIKLNLDIFDSSEQKLVRSSFDNHRSEVLNIHACYDREEHFSLNINESLSCEEKDEIKSKHLVVGKTKNKLSCELCDYEMQHVKVAMSMPQSNGQLNLYNPVDWARYLKSIEFGLSDIISKQDVVCTPGLNKRHISKYKDPYEVLKVFPNKFEHMKPFVIQ